MPKLTRQNKAYLTVEIDDKKYNIPLARSLKVKEVRKLMKVTKLDDLEQFDVMVGFFAEYMGQELVDDLTEGELESLFKLWSKANEETGEVSLGES